VAYSFSSCDCTIMREGQVTGEKVRLARIEGSLPVRGGRYRWVEVGLLCVDVRACVYVRVRVRACVRAWTRARVYVRVRVRERVNACAYVLVCVRVRCECVSVCACRGRSPAPNEVGLEAQVRLVCVNVWPYHDRLSSDGRPRVPHHTTPHLPWSGGPPSPPGCPLRAPAAAGRHTAARDEGRTVIISADPGLVRRGKAPGESSRAGRYT